jgi:predicted GNAT family N-acyltransferase
MSKIVKFNYSNQELHKIAMDIRIKVFVDEQKVPFEMEEEFEKECTHFLIYHRRKPIGTARYRRTDEGIKFERFAMLKESRGKGLGRDLMRFMLTDVYHYHQRIYLNAQVTAVDYYKKSGFVIVGSKFDEAGIDHYPMEYIAQNNLDKALEKAICRR